MSNLKTKFVLGLALVFALAFSMTAEAAITLTLRQGSNNSQVKELQQGLNSQGFTVATTGAGSAGSETNYFGSKTAAAVKAWQASKGLVADGIFGAKSRAAWTGSTPTTPSTLPAGCTSTAGFSPITGVKCDGTGSTTSQTGPVTASFANAPASSTLVAGQATADLAHFAFNGQGTVTTVVLKRLGVSADTTPSNVYLFDGATRLTDAASVSSNGTVTFSAPAGIFTVNGSKTISVRSDIATGTSGQTVGMQLVSFTTSAGTTTANLSGNIHSIAQATLASVSAGTVTPSNATLNPGANVTVWQSTLTVSERDVHMKRFSLRNIGSAQASAFANFKLFVNGVQVATATGLDANGYVTFDMSSTPVTVASGSRVVRVDADIVSGSSRTVHFSLRNAADVDFVDSSFGVNVTATSTPWTAGTANTISGSQGGTLTIERDSTSPSGNTSEGTNDVVLGVFKLTAFGEPMKVENIRATFTGSDATVSSLRNGRIMIGGQQYGSTATLLEDSNGVGYTQYTLNYTVVPGTPVIMELRADMFDNDGTDNMTNGDTIIGTIAVGSSNVQKVDSLGAVSVPSPSTVAANTLTVADASITLTKDGTYANQSVSLPATAFKIGDWNLAGSSTEDVLLTTFSFDVDEVTGATFSEGDLTNLYAVLKNGSTTLWTSSPLATVSATDNNFSLNYTLAKNSSVQIELYANAGADVTAGHSFDTELAITGTTMISGKTVLAGDDNLDGDIDTGEGVEGQTITSGTATITATADASSPVPSIVYDNQTVTAAAFRFAAITAGYNVTDLTFTLADATVAQTVELYDGATLVASRPGSATVTFNGLNWNVPANTNKVLTVKLVLGSVGVGAGTAGANQAVTLSAFTATNTSTGVSDASGNDAGPSIENDPAGSVMYAYAAVPTITNATLPSSILSAGTQALSRVTVATNGSGTVGWNRMVFNIVKTSAPTLASFTLWDVDSNTQVAGTAVVRDTANAASCLATLLGCRVSFVPTVEQQISGAKTYELRATVGGTLVDNDYVSTNINSNTTYVAPTTYILSVPAGSDATYALLGSTASFSWSDVSASNHSTTTSDWNNDYLVKNIPTSSQTLTK